MSPQEAADFIGKMLPRFDPEGLDHAALCVAITALEREDKAEPVAWGVWNAENDQWIDAEKYRAVKNSAHAQPLYASPPAPERP